MIKIKKMFATALILGCFSTGFAQVPSVTSGKLVGADKQGQPCVVTVSDSSGWLSYRLTSSLEYIDDNLVIPIKPTATTGGECSFIPGMGKDTLIVDGNRVIQRRRFAEGFGNWIEETIFIFKDDRLADLVSIQFKVGATQISGYGACSALKAGNLKSDQLCAGLRQEDK